MRAQQVRVGLSSQKRGGRALWKEGEGRRLSGAHSHMWGLPSGALDW